MAGLADRKDGPAAKTGDRSQSMIKRPLVPLVLALMLGLMAAAWGVRIPRPWLLVLLAALLVIMVLLFLGNSPAVKKPPPQPRAPTPPRNEDPSS